MSTPSLRAFYTRVSLTWGFTVRHKGVSAAQPALILPPPTTVIGAFAYPLLRLLGLNAHSDRDEVYGEHRLITPILKTFIENTIVASAALTDKPYVGKTIGLAVHQEIGKIVTAPYKSGGSWDRAIKTKLLTKEFYEDGITQALAVQAVGATYGPGASLELLWILDAESTVKKLGVKLEEFDKLAEKAVHGVVRIGGKESVVTVDHNKAFYDKRIDVLKPGETFETRFYVEKECVTPIETYLVYEITLGGLGGRPVTYYAPSTVASNNLLIPLHGDVAPHFTLIEPCKAYRLSNNAVGVGR